MNAGLNDWFLNCISLGIYLVIAQYVQICYTINHSYLQVGGVFGVNCALF